MKTLIGMTDYISKINTEFNMPTKPFDKNYYFGKMLNYSSFLIQKLELWMFIPCKLVNGVWVVFEKPVEMGEYDDRLCNFCSYPQEGRAISALSLGCEGSRCESAFENYHDEFQTELAEYQEAKERILFEGFEVIKWNHGGESYSIRKNSGTKEEVQVVYYKAIPDYFVWSFKTIEDLVKYNLELTPTVQKQFEL